MKRAVADKKIQELANSVLQDTDYFIVDIKVKGSRRAEISVFIDGSEGNVTLDECAEISKELSFLIDAHEIFNDAYRINVSSPGLSRPLVDRRQYPKNKGRKVAVVYQTDNGKTTTEGMLKEVLEDSIVVKEQDNNISLPFDKIVETKVVPSLR